MRVLVTGGLGVIGSEFARTMLQNGHEVTIIDPAEEKRNEWIWQGFQWKFGKRVELCQLRVEELWLGELEKHLRSVSCVLHAAASTGIPYSAEQPVEDWRRNVEGTRILLDALREVPRPTIILSSVKPYDLSSLLAYEDETRYTLSVGNGVHEAFPLEPDEPYAASKAAQSMLALAYARTYGLPIVTLRCSNLYGPAPCHGPRHGWLTWFCIAAVLGRPIELQGSGKQTRDPLFSDDVTEAILAAHRHIEKVQGQVYNVGGGKAHLVSLRDAIAIIDEVIGKPNLVVPTEGRAHDDPLFVTDSAKFITATGWRPQVDVGWGIRRIIKWAQQHRDELEQVYS